MNITPVSQKHHPNFYAKVYFRGDLEYITEEIKQGVRKRAKNIGGPNDTIIFNFGRPREWERESFSEQGHFYYIPPRITRWIEVHGKIKKQPYKYEERYDKYSNVLGNNHENLTVRTIASLLTKVEK